MIASVLGESGDIIFPRLDEEHDMISFDAIAIDLLSRKLVRAEGVVTHKFPLKDFKAAFQQAEKLEESVKVLLLP